MKNLLWIIGGGAALYFLAKYRMSQKMNFAIDDVSVKGSLFKPMIQITMTLQNPTNTKSVFNSFAGSLYYNGQYLANLSNFGKLDILPNAETRLTITARPSALGVFQSIKDVISQGLKNASIKIDGSANVDGITYPVNIEKQF